MIKEIVLDSHDGEVFLLNALIIKNYFLKVNTVLWRLQITMCQIGAK